MRLAVCAEMMFTDLGGRLRGTVGLEAYASGALEDALEAFRAAFGG